MSPRPGLVVLAISGSLFVGVSTSARADEASPGIHAATADEIAASTQPPPPPPPPHEDAPPLAPRVESVSLAQPATRMRNRGVHYGGIALGLAGLAVFVAGASIQTAHCSSKEDGESSGICSDLVAISGANEPKIFVMVLGGLMTAGGTAMIVVGGWQVPNTPEIKKSKAVPRAAVSFGPTSGSLRVSF